MTKRVMILMLVVSLRRDQRDRYIDVEGLAPIGQRDRYIDVEGLAARKPMRVLILMLVVSVRRDQHD